MMKERVDASTNPGAEQPTAKRRRVTRACDFCHRRGLRCRPANADANANANANAATASSSCQTCIEYRSECMHTRTAAKRGKKPGRSSIITVEFNHHNLPVQTISQGSGTIEDWPSRIQEQRLGHRFQLSVLVDIYFDTVFPIFPCFHEDVFRSQWSDPKFPYDQASYASLMAVLALSARHKEDDALFTPVMRLVERPELSSSARFFSEAVQSIPSKLGDSRHFDYARAAGLLSLCAIQMSRPSLVQQYLGLYHALAGQSGLHDETRWPADVDAAERQTRRHFVWSMYRAEVDTACAVRHVIRSPASQITVAYPSPLEIEGGAGPGYIENWLSGWNIVTDLYRLLELIYVQNRAKNSPIPPLVSMTRGQVDVRTCLANIEKFPDRFNRIVDDPASSNEIKCNIQASSIARTIQLVKVASCSESEAALDVGQETMRALAKIPTAHLRAIGSPLRQQMAEISSLLAEPCKSQTCHADKIKLQETLISIVELLSQLSPGREQDSASGSLLRRLEQADISANQTPSLLQEIQNLLAPYNSQSS